MLFLAVSTFTWAYDYDFTVNGIYYIFISTSEVAVTYEPYTSRGKYYSGSVVIPSKVTYNSQDYDVVKIGNDAFFRCDNMTSITIPSSVISIGDRAFRQCTGLTSITLPASLKTIGDYAFFYCRGLTSITIPTSVTSIGDRAFQLCTGLTSVTIPTNVSDIGNYAFYNCGLLKTVTINSNAVASKVYTTDNNFKTIFGNQVTKYTLGSTVKTLGNYAFYECSGVTSFSLSGNILEIGNYAFYGCSGVTSFSLPNYLGMIGYAAFKNCSGVTSLKIPSYVYVIGTEAFRDCAGLTSVTIPESVAMIGIQAFAGCSNLEKAEFGSIAGLCKIVFWSMESNPLFYAKHLYVDGEEVTDLVIPEGVKRIEGVAFYNSTALKSVTIPSSVSNIGTSAFEGCTGLNSITCKTQSVPTTETNAFNNVPEDATLYVAKAAVSDYQSTSPWSNFTNIQGINVGPLPGDANQNGEIEIGDVTKILWIMAGN